MPAKTNPQEVFDLLTADHRRIRQLFTQFANEGTSGAREQVVRAACRRLAIHSTLEEELFYPRVQDEIKGPDLVDEALVEHGAARDLIRQLDAMSADDPLFEATFRVLGESIEHHIDEEEAELFPEIRRTRVDFVTMAAAMTERRLQLEEEQDEAARA